MNKHIKKVILFSLALVVVGSLNFTKVKAESITNNIINSENIKLKNPIKDCKNYIIYYGYNFDEKTIEKLKTYDLVVINPLEEGANDACKKLQMSGVKVYAYTSSIEIPSADKELINSINYNEKLKVNNNILTHWEKNELGDLKQKSYRTKIINKVIERIYNKGYDGVFVDTLDDLENMDYILEENNVKVFDVETYMKEMEQAGADFIKELKNANPKLSIIQNRGFQLLDKGTNKFVDAVLYEDICKSADETFYINTKAILDRYTLNNNGIVMALPNQNKYYEESKKIAKDNKWLYYQTNNYEDTLIIDGLNYK
ncbi:hypothetical protein UT300005_10050 [Clostridium sp. CTA-5]